MQNNFQPLCFKVHYDTDVQCDVVSTLLKFGPVIFDHNDPIVFLDYDKSKSELLNKLHKLGLSEFWCEKIDAEQCSEQDNFISVWFYENYAKQSNKFVEYYSQKELQEIMQKINKINAELDKRQEGVNENG